MGAARKGDWKIVKKLDEENWHLFNIREDRIESMDLADQYPDIVEDISLHWEEWANTHFVLPKRVS